MRSQPPQIMRMLGPSEVMSALDFTGTIETLRQMFRLGAEAPVRHHHKVPVPGAPDATLLLMPAWQVGRHIGVKLATVFPGNAEKSLPSVMGAYLLLDGKSGQPLALMDGPALTSRRTAAASALAAIYLARPDASRLLMVGTGAMAPQLVEAHASVRPIKQVVIWGRHLDKAQRLAHRLSRRNLAVSATDDLANAVRGADIISCATLSKEPLIKGHWLKLGTHVDLVGGFTPEMREADDEVIRRARVFVDTRDGALMEAGDIVQPLRAGVLHESDIAGDLFDLTRGSRAGRRYYDQITLFKSVGTALEDLAAAQLAFNRATT
ncbi:MAG TPA: ornithine cyclodeaminase family protein [Stellaceae bacterium]|nr:ornithine cyclodeaminase family protein [Stellaceae bacterium]